MQGSNLDFGICLINEPSSVRQIIAISNTGNRHTRTFEVKLDDKFKEYQNFDLEMTFEIDSMPDSTSGDSHPSKTRIISKEAVL